MIGGGRTVLLAWEMGAGRGHATRLLILARALKAEGWTPVVAAREPQTLADQYAAAGVPLVQAPGHEAQLKPGESFSARSYADVMAICGYRSADALGRTVQGWDAVLAEHRPAVIIADYCPILPLAALGRIPLITVGDGFVTPPGHVEAMPVLREEAGPLEPAEVLLEQAAAVQRARGAALPASLPALAAGDRTVVCTFPELDVYREHRREPASGPLTQGLAPLAPLEGAPSVFAYLAADYGPTGKLLQALADSGLPVEAYVRDPPEHLAGVMASKGMRLLTEARPLAERLAGASVLVHHGGIGAAEEGLMLGRPQLVFPRHLEQVLTGRNLARLGVAVALPPATNPARMVEVVRGAAVSRKGAANASLAAARLAERRSVSLERILDACRELGG